MKVYVYDLLLETAKGSETIQVCVTNLYHFMNEDRVADIALEFDKENFRDGWIVALIEEKEKLEELAKISKQQSDVFSDKIMQGICKAEEWWERSVKLGIGDESIIGFIVDYPHYLYEELVEFLLSYGRHAEIVKELKERDLSEQIQIGLELLSDTNKDRIGQSELRNVQLANLLPTS